MQTRDLIFNYSDGGNEKVHRVYLHIFDFTDEIEAKSENAPPLNGFDVNACFFGNPLTAQHFETIEDLYNHCKCIMR